MHRNSNTVSVVVAESKKIASGFLFTHYPCFLFRQSLALHMCLLTKTSEITFRYLEENCDISLCSFDNSRAVNCTIPTNDDWASTWS